MSAGGGDYISHGEGEPAAPSPTLSRDGSDLLYFFRAMACPCEVRIESDDSALALRVAHIAEAEARRIENKFSRYRADSIVAKINSADGNAIDVDDETAGLLDFAAHCFELSDGRFDITSGVLRRVWTFDGSDRVPGAAEIKSIQPLIGWQKVLWKRPVLRLLPGTEIDLGGLGKEYAVDSAMRLVRASTDCPVLINFGGDLCVSGPRRRGGRWKIAIESVDQNDRMAGLIELAGGAIATSGDARRFLLKDGVRYSHILNALTGHSVTDAPRSVTVAAPTCIEAGMIATLAVLQGRRAEAFLKREKIRAWCIR